MADDQGLNNRVDIKAMRERLRAKGFASWDDADKARADYLIEAQHKALWVCSDALEGVKKRADLAYGTPIDATKICGEIAAESLQQIKEIL